jgi:protein-disulfide isomerase
MKRALPFLIVTLVGVATITAGTILYRAKRPSQLTLAANTADGSAHALGPANAAVVVEEFGDFECPPCGKLSDPLNEIERDFAPRVRLVFHHFPLPNHKYSHLAAYAAEAAALQGKFWEMHDQLYHDQEVWANSADADALFNVYARYVGLNGSKFKADIGSDEVKERVESDHKQGVTLGIEKTPTIFINKQLLDPKKLNPTDLRAAVEEALKGTKPSS